MFTFIKTKKNLQLKKDLFTFGKNKREQGFTIVELIFVIIIFGILSSMTFFDFRTFNARVSFDNLTQDVALKIVQAQKNARDS